MPATAAVLRELCGGLININGQHDSVGLLNPAHHLGILDDYAQNRTVFQEYYTLYRELVQVKRELDALITDEAEKQRKIDLLQYQVQEIEDAGLTAGEGRRWKTAGRCCPMRLPSGTGWRKAMRCFPAVMMPQARWIFWGKPPTRWMPLRS